MIEEREFGRLAESGRFQRVDRLESLRQRFADLLPLAAVLALLAGQWVYLAGRFDVLDDRLDRVELRMDRIDDRLARIEQAVTAGAKAP
jgi:hypothetical protein